MTVLRRPTEHSYSLAPPPEFTPHVRPMRDDELPWAIHSWIQGWKDAPGNHRRKWSDYKAHHVQPIRDALCRPDTKRLACDGPIPGRAVGWMAWSRWPSLDVMHWVYVSKPCWKRGCMKALVASAEPRRSIVYTFQSAQNPKLSRGPNGGPGRNDEWLSEWLRDRGHVVSYVPFQEWAR